MRKDDDPEVFKTRLAAYFRDTAAVTPYYRAKGGLCMRSTAWRAIARRRERDRRGALGVATT